MGHPSDQECGIPGTVRVMCRKSVPEIKVAPVPTYHPTQVHRVRGGEVLCIINSAMAGDW